MPWYRGIFALFDAVFAVCVTVILSVFIYWQNNGIPRAFILLPCVAGFVLYILTLGKLVMAFSETIVRFLRFLVLVAVMKPICRVVSFIRLVCGFLWSATGKRVFCAFLGATDKKRTEKELIKTIETVRKEICTSVCSDSAGHSNKLRSRK